MTTLSDGDIRNICIKHWAEPISDGLIIGIRAVIAVALAKSSPVPAYQYQSPLIGKGSMVTRNPAPDAAAPMSPSNWKTFTIPQPSQSVDMAVVTDLVRQIHQSLKRGKDTQDHGLIGNLRCILDSDKVSGALPDFFAAQAVQPEQAEQERFNDWMINVAKIDPHSPDMYPRGLTKQYWSLWQSARATQPPSDHRDAVRYRVVRNIDAYIYVRDKCDFGLKFFGREGFSEKFDEWVDVRVDALKSEAGKGAAS